MMRVFCPFPHWWAILTRLSLRSLILPALCLALGATYVWAQATDQSIDVPIGGSAYTITAADFGFDDIINTGASDTIMTVGSLPALGNLRRYTRGRVVTLRVGSLTDGDTSVSAFFETGFNGLDGAGSDNRLDYTPPADAVSVAAGYASFAFYISTDGSTDTMATMTINLVGASMPTTATGAPEIAATDTHRIRASITGVTDLNGIDVGTLSWQWQQADAPVSGVPDTGDYIDIKDATSSSLFAPTAAQLSRYVRACVSFKDQSPTPASEGPLCSIGILVTELPSEIRLRLRLFLEGPLR